jgi:ferredoxin
MITVHNVQIPTVGTLLESLEKAGFKVESQCRQGYCGACRTMLKQGEVAYATEPLGFTRPGEVLACCCTPTSDIEIQLHA